MRSERQVLIWLAALVVVTLAVMALRQVLMPFLIGLLIAYALNPLADRLQRLGLPRMAAAALLVAGLIVLIGALFVVLVPQLVGQIQQLVKSAPADFERLRTMTDDLMAQHLGPRAADLKVGIDKAIADTAANWSSHLPTVLASVLSRGQALLSGLSLLLITPLVVFYLVADWHKMLDAIASWLPRAQEPAIRRLAGDVDRAIGAFIRGQGLVSLILTVFYTVALSLAGIRYSLLLGLATGALSFVPFVGWALGLIAALAVAAAQFWPVTGPLLVVLAIFAAGQVLDAAYLSPQIVGSKIGLHPVWLILALAVFSALFGFVGVLVAVPLAAAAGVLVRHALQLYLASPLYGAAGSPIGKPGSAGAGTAAQHAPDHV